jgi:hypothetical protein
MIKRSFGDETSLMPDFNTGDTDLPPEDIVI